jgi:Uri superfamily endonuclease
MELREPVTIKLNVLGVLSFPAGYYAYVGSALRNSDSRIMRHLRHPKKKRWHIDYLREKAEVKKIYLSNLDECSLNQMLTNIPGYEVIAPGFGSSDCNRCMSHLAFFSKEPDLSTLGIWE